MALSYNSFKKPPYEIDVLDGIRLANNGSNSKVFIKCVKKILRKTISAEEFKIIRHENELAKACLELSKNEYFQFENDIDKQLLEKLRRIENKDSISIIESFRALCRGYSDNQIPERIRLLKDERNTLNKRILSFANKNERMLNGLFKKKNKPQQSNSPSKPIRALFLRRNMNEMIKLKNLVAQIYKNINQLAVNDLYWETICRRDRSAVLSASIWHNPERSRHFNYFIKNSDPKNVMFPLRFLAHIPADEYRDLLRKWKHGVDKSKLFLSLKKKNNWDETFDVLKKMNGSLRQHLKSDRKKIIDEIEQNWKRHCYVAATLLAIVHIEGLLWDFAKYLSRKNFRIIKKKSGKKEIYHPYVWDHEQGQYKNIGSTKRPIAEKGELHSVRKLLEKTRLGTMINSNVFCYLVDEFYDDRNSLAHGNIDNRNFEADSVSSILCLEMCYNEIFDKIIGREERFKMTPIQTG